jgi:surface antigen
MIFRKLMLGAATMALLIADIAAAQPVWVPPGNDPDGYYSQADRNGYYDRDGRYRRIRAQGRGYYDNGPPPPPPPPGMSYYEQGRYEQNCRSNGNQVAGTIFGALAGGLLGGGVSRGNGGAVIGGAVLGGLLGNVITRDIDCEDQPVAFQVYATGLNGDIGRRYDWRNRGNYGYFTPTREFRRRGQVCREFTETTYRGNRPPVTRSGVACRETGGHWRFD